MTKSKVMEELAPPPQVLIDGKLYPIKRKPMRKVFQLLNLLQGGFGELMDAMQGNLPPDVLQQVAEAPDEEAQQKIIHTYMASTDSSINGQVKRLLTKEDVFYDVLALALDSDDREWIADNVTMDVALQAIAIVMEQEMSVDFFAGVIRTRTVWDRVKTLTTETTTESMSRPTSSDGFGSLSENSPASGPLSPSPLS